MCIRDRVESVDDVLEELGPMASSVKLNEETTIRRPAELKLSEQESKVLNVIGTEATEFDDIVEQTELPAARILSTISVLEMRKLIRRVSGTAMVRI